MKRNKNYLYKYRQAFKHTQTIELYNCKIKLKNGKYKKNGKF